MIGAESRNSLQSKEQLSEIKQFLLNIAEDLLVQKKIDTLYPLDLLEIAKKRGKYPEDKLFQNISELYEKKWIVPDENLTKNLVLDILDHQRVYKFVKKNPGCDTLEVMTGVGISFRYALKNLETLFKFGFIRAHKFTQYFLYFPYYMREEEDPIYCYTRSQTNRQILRYLFEQKTGATAAELARELQKRDSLVKRKLTQLTKAQLVSHIQNAPIAKYKVNDIDKKCFEEILERYKKH